MSAGLAALEYGGARPDFARLRRERRARLVAALREAGLDALLLGREANARYAAGARRLWTAGSRPFAPGCVVLASGAVHLMSTWDEGVPEEIPHARLYGTTWNPARLMQSLCAIPGLGDARRVGVDGMSAAFARGATGAGRTANPAADVSRHGPARIARRSGGHGWGGRPRPSLARRLTSCAPRSCRNPS